MTDVLFVAIILVLVALGFAIWLSTKGKKKAQSKPTVSLIEFFVTFMALINSFIVIILGFAYVNGAIVRPSWMIAGFLFALGIAGIVLAYVDRFRKRKVQQINPIAKKPKKPK